MQFPAFSASILLHAMLVGVFVVHVPHHAPSTRGVSNAVSMQALTDVTTTTTEMAPSEISDVGAIPQGDPHKAPKHEKKTNASRDLRGDVGAREMHGHWVGTYTCLGLTYHLTIEIDSNLNVLGNAISPWNDEASYKQHAFRTASGVVMFMPDGWTGEPMRGHHLSGMHGRFSGDTFSGMIDDAACAAVTMHRT